MQFDHYHFPPRIICPVRMSFMGGHGLESISSIILAEVESSTSPEQKSAICYDLQPVSPTVRSQNVSS
jgi:hypothetical protein